MKKIVLFVIIILSIFLGLRYGENIGAFYGSGEYINIYGYYGNPISCKDPESCNQFHLAGNRCVPDSGNCKAEGNQIVFKWVCDGKEDLDCGGGVHDVNPRVVKRVQNGSLKVDGDGVTCGQTVQLDVYDKNPEAGGGWDPTAQTIDYLVWYSGDCPVPTATPTSSPTPTTSGTGPTTGTGTGGTGDTPTSTPTPTTAPGCNVSCDGKPANFCQQASDGCTVCDLTSKKCVPPNTQPPTTGTGTGPTTTGTGTGPTTGTGTGSQPSPTPDFNSSMCACDGIESTSIFPGQPVEVTAYGKVEGANTSKAKIESMQFLLYEGQNNTAAVLQSQTIAATVAQSSSSKVRYSAKWSTVIPSTVKAGATYRIQAKLKCVKKTTAMVGEDSAVLGEATSPSVLSNIFTFFRNLFRRGPQQQDSVSSVPSPTVSIDTPQGVQEITDNSKTLQLKTIHPAQTETDKCSIIRFKFSQ